MGFLTDTIYTVNYIFEGVHIDREEDMEFQKIESEIYNLDEWVGISGFVPEKFDLETFKRHEIDIHYKLPESIKFSINENFKGQLNFFAKRPGLSRFQNEMAISQKVKLAIISESNNTLEKFLNLLFIFQNFLTLALYKRTYPVSINLSGNNFTAEYGNGEIVKKTIKLYIYISNIDRLSKTKMDLEMLFSYRQIQTEFPAIIKNWYKKYELLEPAFNLLFEQFNNNKRFSENNFLNLAQSAETFHARVHNHTRIPKNEFQKMKNEIYSLVPEAYHTWLKDQFNFGNNLNLHTRLTEIVNKYSNAILDKIIGDKDLFVKQVKWSRNYYTHYSSDGRKNALKGKELYFLSEKLKIVLVCSFLLEIGFDNNKLENLLEHNKHRFFNHLVNW